MSTQNQTLTLQNNSQMAQMKNTVQAIMIDTFLWGYIFLVSYKIIFQKLIMDMRYADFSWNQPLLALGLGFLSSLLLFFTPVSLGRAVKGLYNFEENETLIKKPFALLGYFTIVLTFIAGLFISQVSMREFFSPAGMAGAKRIYIIQDAHVFRGIFRYPFWRGYPIS